MSKNTHWKQAERETVKDLRSSGYDAERNWSKQFSEKDGCDVRATDGSHTLIVQVKNQKQPNMRKAYKEAKSAITGKNNRAVARCHYRGTRETYAILSWKDFVSLLRGEWLP
jgi:Holliday junction resolvase